MSLVLASASPRRRAILATLGITFEALASDVDERARAGEGPVEMAERLAVAKALDVSVRAVDQFVLGADTVVVCGERVLGKPRDDNDGAEMIEALSGRWHDVVTGVALARGSAVLESMAVTTRVRFAPLAARTIERYVATGEGRDKAGGYAVQGIGAGLVERLEGSYSNVVGLPAHETVAMLVRQGALSAWP